VGSIYDRYKTKKISDLSGLLNQMPVYSWFFLFFALANCGLPGTSSFVGELLIIISSFKANFIYAFISSSTLIISAFYSLWLVKRVIYGEIKIDLDKNIDANNLEKLILFTLALIIIILGIYPDFIMNFMNTSLRHISETIIFKL
jgi:NADH-quinone oxidoreductase subunit M